MVDRDKALDLLENLAEIIAELRGYQRLPSDRVIGDRQVQSAVRYAFLTAIQCVLDIGLHALTDSGVARPPDNRSIIRALGERAIVPAELARRVEGMAGFRNLLVHSYAIVDSKLVDDHLRARLGDLETMASHLREFVTRQRSES